nr:NlpC/P60 family protein [Corynebacterium lactis]
MSSNSSLQRRSALRAAAGATVISGIFAGAVGVAPLSHAQEAAPSEFDLATADGIVAELEKLSRETEGVSEEVNGLEVEVKAKEDELRNAEEALNNSRGKVAEAQRDLDALAGDISYFSKKRMRGEVIDPLTAVLGSGSAQDAIDRSSYINKMFRDNDETVSRVAGAKNAAKTEENNALRLQADIKKQIEGLELRRTELDRRSADLEGRADQVRHMVEGLSPEQRAIWMSKNNPITEGLKGLLGSSAAVDAAMAKLGAPYAWGAAGPSEFDCSGLMMWAYQQIGKSIPRTSQAQLAGGTPVSRDQLQPGDIIGFYPGVTHVGMYIGNGQIIHASDYGIPVQVVSIDQGAHTRALCATRPPRARCEGEARA